MAVADADATDQGLDSTSKKALPVVSEAAERKARKETFFKAIPFSAEALQASNKKLEDAYYNLGKIYDLELNEPKNAITSFDTLLTRFSGTEYKPEVFYFLYLIYDRMQDARRNEYEGKLLQDYPNSTFARLIKSAGSADALNESDNRAKEAYAQAYAFYETGNYDQALKEISQALADYPKSASEEKFVLLRIFITGKTQPVATYQQALNDFIRDYPTSTSLPRVRDLLKASEAFSLNR